MSVNTILELKTVTSKTLESEKERSGYLTGRVWSRGKQKKRGVSGQAIGKEDKEKGEL